MKLTIKREWHEDKWEFKATYSGCGGAWCNWGKTPREALQRLCDTDIAGYIFADTIREDLSYDDAKLLAIQNGQIQTLEKQVRKLKKQLKGMK